jgi:hypothetical protein
MCTNTYIAIKCSNPIIFDGDLPPELFEFNQSTEQAFYFFEVVSINLTPVDSDDWVGAFNGDICVGSIPWSGEYTTVPAMGYDDSSYSEGYLLEGNIPSFVIYDRSEESYYPAVASEDIEWENNLFATLDFVNVYPDCNAD